jgi:tripartite-type tricarboxylate transporter receptor subunit TctC
MNLRRIAPFGVALTAAALLVSPSIVSAQNWSGKTLKIIVPYGPGGTYDKYSHSFSRHLGKHIAGNPNIILQHMPGAGGTKAMNWHYNVAPKNGETMLMPLDNTVVNQLLRPGKIKYDARGFTWLGSSNQTNQVFIIRADTGVKSWKDLKGRNTIAAAAGKAGFDHVTMSLARSLLKFNLKIVTGYKGSTATTFAVEQGEVESNCNNWLAYSSKVPHWFTGEKPFANAVIQMGIFRDPDLPDDIPLLHELVSDPMDKAAVDFVSVAGLLGRGLVVPPKTSKSTISMLRAAYDKMNVDGDFKAELKKKRLRLIAANGAEIQKIVNKAINEASPEVVAHAQKLIVGKSN